MNNTPFTPGPWVFAYGAVYRADTLHDESSIRIALMDRNEPHTTPVERDANARLIAAAPELYSACQAALVWHLTADDEKSWTSGRLAVAETLRRALAKAGSAQ